MFLNAIAVREGDMSIVNRSKLFIQPTGGVRITPRAARLNGLSNEVLASHNPRSLEACMQGVSRAGVVLALEWCWFALVLVLVCVACVRANVYLGLLYSPLTSLGLLLYHQPSSRSHTPRPHTPQSS